MQQHEQKRAARDFVERWKAAEGNEQRESNSFWIELCGEVLGIVWICNLFINNSYKDNPACLNSTGLI
ncbi:MAG: hypothetical protein IJV62_04440 [Eggerthellaceae bacterium]|nr:hypothetical protein [Eggerthellaceae bacterium]